MEQMNQPRKQSAGALSSRASHSHASSSAARIDQMTALLVYAPDEAAQAPIDRRPSTAEHDATEAG